MKDWYETWDEAKRDMFADEPEDALGSIVRKYFDRRYEYEAHEWHRVVVTPEYKSWAENQIKENEERAVQSILMDWGSAVCENREGEKWHDFGWRAFTRNLRSAFGCVKMDERGNTDASAAGKLLESLLTFDGLIDFEWRLHALCDFVMEMHGGCVHAVKDGLCVARENECELRLLALSHIMRGIHDNAVALLTICAMHRRYGLAVSFSDNVVVHDGVFECDKTLAQMHDDLPRDGLAVVETIMACLDQIKTATERGAAAAERSAKNSQSALDEMKEWNGYIKQLIAGYDGPEISYAPLTANKQQAIFNAWNEYVRDCKRRHKRARFADCLDEHGKDEICSGHTMLELVPTAKILEKVIHNVKEQARRR